MFLGAVFDGKNKYFISSINIVYGVQFLNDVLHSRHDLYYSNALASRKNHVVSHAWHVLCIRNEHGFGFKSGGFSAL